MWQTIKNGKLWYSGHSAPYVYYPMNPPSGRKAICSKDLRSAAARGRARRNPIHYKALA